MTAAVTKTVMLRTAGQRTVWTHHCLLWYVQLFQDVCFMPQPSSLLIITTENTVGDASLCYFHYLQSKQSSLLSDRDTAEEDSDPLDDCSGFWRVQRRLQEEARVALALARPMARMQVEVERQIQLHRRSPVADLVSERQLSLNSEVMESKPRHADGFCVIVTVNTTQWSLHVVGTVLITKQDLKGNLCACMCKRKPLIQVNKGAKICPLFGQGAFLNLEIQRPKCTTELFHIMAS